MCRDGIRWNDRGDQRHTIGGARDVTVRDARPPRNPDPRVLTQLIPAAFHGNPERLDLLPFEHGPAVAIAVEGHEQAAIVGRVQLSAEGDIPPARRLQHWKSRADLLENP